MTPTMQTIPDRASVTAYRLLAAVLLVATSVNAGAIALHRAKSGDAAAPALTAGEPRGAVADRSATRPGRS